VLLSGNLEVIGLPLKFIEIFSSVSIKKRIRPEKEIFAAQFTA
jgi:hypothetical protein